MGGPERLSAFVVQVQPPERGKQAGWRVEGRGELFPTRDCIDPQLLPRWPLDEPGTRALEFRTSVFVD